ncbi:unnamed protein product [Cylicocyclus nassatus]|uniref:Uncharacterized protein n=1 Tax=Cylicocyclus nassatus TaxID=53992 RepID=A0AA36M2F8_CYLNA|nr:unnamed protein product [Cylicocyclus nassatus]
MAKKVVIAAATKEKYTGYDYGSLAPQAEIAKTTCSSWEKEFKEQIDLVKRQQLQELAESYSIGKEARIKRLGSTLAKINEALEEVDYSQIPPEKLLDFKLKYTEALKQEYIELQPAIALEKDTADNILAAYANLYSRARLGDITKDQIEKESTILTGAMKAYEATELKNRLESIEAALGNRPVIKG